MDYLATLMLAGSLAGFYTSAWAASALRRWRRAADVWHLLPLGGVCVVAAALGRPALGLAAALGGALAGVGLVAGMTLAFSRGSAGSGVYATPVLMLLPASLAVILVGLSGWLTPLAAGLLAVMAAASWLAGTGVGHGGPDAAAGLTASSGSTADRRSVFSSAPSSPRGTGSAWVDAVQLGLGSGVALLAGWAAVEAATQLGARHVHAPPGVLAACVIGPAATLPLLGWCTRRSADAGVMTAIAFCAAYAVRCIVVLVPAVLVVHAGRVVWCDGWQGDLGIVFPPTLYRVEAALLLTLGILLSAIAAGRLTPSRRDGVLLLTVYLAYIVLTSVWGVRSA